MKKELTKNEALQKCRDMWNEIAVITEEEKYCLTKEEYFSRKGIPDDDIPLVRCYCCEYSLQTNGDCSNCPLNFPKNPYIPGCLSRYSPYHLWGEAIFNEDWKSADYYARQIANLPENPDCK